MSDKEYQQPRNADSSGSELGDENSFMKFFMSDEAAGARKRYMQQTNRLIAEGAESGPQIKNPKHIDRASIKQD